MDCSQMTYCEGIPETAGEPFYCDACNCADYDPAYGDVLRARFRTGGGYRLLASANFGELVLGGIEAKFSN